MKLCPVSLFFALLVAVCLTGVAQSQIRLNVPFEFSVGGASPCLPGITGWRV